MGRISLQTGLQAHSVSDSNPGIKLKVKNGSCSKVNFNPTTSFYSLSVRISFSIFKQDLCTGYEANPTTCFYSLSVRISFSIFKQDLCTGYEANPTTCFYSLSVRISFSIFKQDLCTGYEANRISLCHNYEKFSRMTSCLPFDFE